MLSNNTSEGAYAHLPVIEEEEYRLQDLLYKSKQEAWAGKSSFKINQENFELQAI